MKPASLEFCTSLHPHCRHAVAPLQAPKKCRTNLMHGALRVAMRMTSSGPFLGLQLNKLTHFDITKPAVVRAFFIFFARKA